MTEQLVPPAARRPALVAIVLCALVTVGLGVHYADTYKAGRIDRALDLRIQHRLAADHHLMRYLVHFGDPITVALLSLALALVCAARHKWRGMVLAAVAPAVAGGLTDLVLKPLIDRHIGHGLSFPSGHTTGAFAVAITAAVLLLEGRGIRNPLRVALTVLSLGLAACVAAAVVALGVHYTTDTIGGFCVALGVVLALALVIDEIAERRAQPSASSRNRA